MRKFAKVEDVREGTVLEADGGFTCIEKGAKLKTWLGGDGILCVNCRDGVHGLDGQLDDEGQHYVGFYKVEA